MLINTIYITLICVIVTDQLHFWDDFSPYIKSWMTGGKMKSPIDFKLFRCSTCQSWWLNLIYITVSGVFSMGMVVFILFLSWMAPVINDILTLLRHTINKILNKLN